MKKILTILCASILIVACTTSNKQAINSKDLQGRYDVDFSALLADLNKGNNDPFSTAIAASLLSSMEMTMQFEGNKLIFDASGVAMNFVKSFVKNGMETPIVLEYKIVNDSVLYIKEEDKEFIEFGVLRKIADSYDYLQLVENKKDGSQNILNLKKIIAK